MDDLTTPAADHQLVIKTKMKSTGSKRSSFEYW